MKQFKIFEANREQTVDEVANEWLKQNPNIKIVDYQYKALIDSTVNNQGSAIVKSYDSIFLVYEV